MQKRMAGDSIEEPEAREDQRGCFGAAACLSSGSGIAAGIPMSTAFEQGQAQADLNAAEQGMRILGRSR